MHLHIDCFSGMSGDMFLGALVDAGVPLATLKRDLKKLEAGGYQLKASKVYRGSLHVTKVDVHVKQGFTKPLSLPKIRRIISQGNLPTKIKRQSLDVFQRLAEAEGIVHGVPQSKVHFHEVGVIDSLVDIVGAFLGCHYLGVTTISASPVNVGSGTIRTAHGILPVPGPAVAQLAIGKPIYSSGPPLELTTPTGMGILTTLTEDFRQLPPMNPSQIGYGAGTADPANWSNVLRIFLNKEPSSSVSKTETISEIQTTLDDLNPQVYESVMEELFSIGALDVTLTPVIMKRTRPGIILTVLAETQMREAIIQAIFRETTTLGVRVQTISRQVLPRTFQKVKLSNGTVHIKVASLGNDEQKVMPEYRDCLAIAKKRGRPVREIIDEARRLYHSLNRSSQKRRKKGS